jgi:hypothetical protein
MSEQVIVDVQKIADEAMATERKRISDIRNLATGMSITGDIVDKMVNEGKGIVDALEEFTAAKKISAALPQGAAPIPPKTPDIKFISDDADKFRAGASAALLVAANMPVDQKTKADVFASEMPRNMSGLMRASLIRNGMNPSRASYLDGTDLLRATLNIAKNAASVGTGDFINVLADTVGKSLGMGYDNANTTFDKWMKVWNAKDFKNQSVVKMSSFGDMDTIPEGFPFQHGAFSDKKEQGAVSVKGKTVTISMQTFVNDDINALTRIPEALGRSYKKHQNKLAYDYLFGTAAVGPTLLEADSNGGYSAFNSYRGNFASGTGVPSISTLNAARKAMALQTGVKGKASDTAYPQNYIPKYFITGATQTPYIENVQNTRTNVDTNASLGYNPYSNEVGNTKLILISDGYIDTLSTTAWWLATDEIETIVMLALDGKLQPTTRSEDSRVGEALGVSFDVFGAYAPMMIDYRGMYCHKGA